MKIGLMGDATSIHLQRLGMGLARRGHDVRIISHKQAAITGVPVERFQIPGPSLSNLRRWRGRWQQYLRTLLGQFDIVNVHSLADWGFTPELLHDGTVVATAWGSDVVNPPDEVPASESVVRARKTLLQEADAVTVCGPSFARTVASFAEMDIDRIDVVPFGVDTDLFQPAKLNPRREEGPARVGFFKGFRAVYGASYLIRAIPKILEACPNVGFELIGDGPELAHCRSLADVLSVSASIDWIPRQPHAALPQYIQRWNISVIPSICEAFGVAALESSACEVPVVASDVGGLEDTVQHQKTGLRVPPALPEELASAVVRLLRDDPTRHRMGQSGRRFVQENFQQEQVLDTWETLYERVLDRSLVIV